MRLRTGNVYFWHFTSVKILGGNILGENSLSLQTQGNGFHDTGAVDQVQLENIIAPNNMVLFRRGFQTRKQQTVFLYTDKTQRYLIST